MGFLFGNLECKSWDFEIIDDNFNMKFLDLFKGVTNKMQKKIPEYLEFDNSKILKLK